MMKTIRHMFALLAMFGGAIAAATVPQNSAEKYYFSRPNLPSNIVGVVMGDPPAYNLPRSEDVAWLREAWCERAAMVAGGGGWNGLPEYETEVPVFGKWPLAETNRFRHWTTATELLSDGVLATNIIVGYALATNNGYGVDTAHIVAVDPSVGIASLELLANTNNIGGGFLTPTNSVYVDEATAWWMGDPAWRGTVTNIADELRWFPAWTNATNTVSMAMTNGTVSVWTNVWQVFAPTSATFNVTNIQEKQLGGPGLLFKDRLFHGYNRPLPRGLLGILDTAAFTNQYDFLRGLHRIIGETAATNSMLATGYTEWDGGESWSGVTNNTAAYPYINISASINRSATFTNYWTTGENPQLVWGRKDTETCRNLTYKSYDGYQIYFVDHPKKALIPDGRDMSSIRAAKLYGTATVYYSYSAGASPDKDYDTNMTWQAVLPMGAASLATDGTNIFFGVEMTHSVLADAWSAAQPPVASLPSNPKWLPDLKWSLPTPSHGDTPNDITPTSTSAYARLQVFLDSLYLLLDLAPRTSLPDW